MKRRARGRLVTEIEFKLKKGKRLVVWFNSSLGIDRIIVKNRGGVVEVKADGHSKFEFNKKIDRGAYDFFLTNLSGKSLLKDYLDGRFWGQFAWGTLLTAGKDKKIRVAIKKEIGALVEEFESTAAARLNRLFKKLKSKK